MQLFFYFLFFQEEFSTDIFWSNKTKAKAKTPICNTFCVHGKKNNNNRVLFLAKYLIVPSPPLSISPSFLSEECATGM